MKLTLLWLYWVTTALLINSVRDQPRSDMATVIIYRNREFGGMNYVVSVNGKEASSLATNRYIKVEVPMGRVVIHTRRKYLASDSKAYFDAQPSRTYYVKAVEDIGGVIIARSLLMGFVSEEQAKRELNRIKPMEPAQSNQNHE